MTLSIEITLLLFILIVLGLSLAFQNRAAYQQAERRIAEANRQSAARALELRMLKDLAETLNQTLPPERALEAGLELVARQVGAISGWFLTLTPEQKAELSAGYMLPTNMEIARQSGRPWALCACLKDTLAGQLESPRRFACERLAQLQTAHEGEKQHLSIPVRASGVPVGILNLVFPGGRVLDEAEIKMLSALGNQFGGASERTRLFQNVHRLAISDSLTGLYNRRHFLALAEKELERARRYSHPISLAILDIDFFKKINDTYGHLAGDQVLIEVARLCQESIRRIDLSSRYGGEEFVILMPETGPLPARQAMERLRRRIERQEVMTPRGIVRATISVGLTSLVKIEEMPFDRFLDQADLALYQAKKRGRNQVCVL